MAGFALGVSLFALGMALWTRFVTGKRIQRLVRDNVRLLNENIGLRFKLAEYEVEHEKVD